MIVSMAKAVLPVPRSPMINSRWPRPMGIMESMAFRPVWSGSFTGWRTTIPGAFCSMFRKSLASIGGPFIDGLSQGVDHPADELLAYGDLGDPAGPLDRCPLP